MPEIGFDPVAAFQAQTLLETRRQQLQLRDQLRSDVVRQNDVREQQLIEDRRRDDVRTEALRQRQIEEDRRAQDLQLQDLNERLLRLDLLDQDLPRGSIAVSYTHLTLPTKRIV